MHKRTLIVASLVMFSTFSAAATHADVVLVQDGKANCAIFVAPRVMEPDAPGVSIEHPWAPKVVDEYTRQRLRESTKDLAAYIEKMSGAKVEIITDAQKVGDDRTPIWIGERAQGVFGAPGKSAPYKQGFRCVIGSGGKGIGLYGESDLASSYAIYELLDRLGCRWYMPTEQGEVIPAIKSIRLNELDFSSAPGTIWRGVWWGGEDYKRRNRMGGLYLSASHALDSYIPKEVLDKHPDWVAVIKGKPQPPIIKWTKPEIADAMADVILGHFDSGVYKDSASLSPEDGIAFDESEDRQHDAGDFDPIFNGPSITDRLMILCNRVAEKVTKRYPDAKFGVIAYVNYNRPPVREPVHPSVVPVIAPISYSRAHPVTDDGEPNNKVLRELIEGWGKKAKMTGNYYYCYNLAEISAPNPQIRKWSIDVPFALKNGCQFFQPETDTTWESTLHALYLGTRLAWDPSLDPKAIIDELHTKFYGNAAAEMAAYWEYVDRCWVETPEYSGAALGYMRRFPLDKVKEMRRLMDAGIAKAQTPQEKFRITMADESLKQFESYMQMRWDLTELRNLDTIGDRAKAWVDKEHALAEQYRPQFAFSCRMYGKAPFWGSNNGVDFFNAWYKPAYDDANRISRDFAILTPQPLRQWRWMQDKDKQGETLGYARADLDDKAWKTTDVGIETWSTLGMHNYYGRVWYRTNVKLPVAADGKKTFLWLAGHDGAARVFVNGRAVPYVNAKGEKAEEFVGFCNAGSFDITEALSSNEQATISILCDRRDVNEIGSGGLIGPLMIYREK